ncbi:TcpD family membrane protein [uncultured Lactococcus sp.]|uniref:TcpD family membrane protein n=1 Tax=uncultured Lactococcus sp. TaxID=167973 RepID=UPI0027DB8E56|nr:TcpD family membrane protein [uncultured Lactococcus sp.]
MGLFTAVWGMCSGLFITFVVFKIIQSFLKGQPMKIVIVLAAGVAVWMFATFPTQTLNLLAGVFKRVMDWMVGQFKL